MYNVKNFFIVWPVNSRQSFIAVISNVPKKNEFQNLKKVSPNLTMKTIILFYKCSMNKIGISCLLYTSPSPRD